MSRPPLIRQGAGPNELERIYTKLEHERQDLIRMIDASTAPLDNRKLIGARSPAGDESRLRGIPAIGQGVTGAIPGTSPHHTR